MGPCECAAELNLGSLQQCSGLTPVRTPGAVFGAGARAQPCCARRCPISPSPLAPRVFRGWASRLSDSGALPSSAQGAVYRRGPAASSCLALSSCLSWPRVCISEKAHFRALQPLPWALQSAGLSLPFPGPGQPHGAPGRKPARLWLWEPGQCPVQGQREAAWTEPMGTALSLGEVVTGWSPADSGRFTAPPRAQTLPRGLDWPEGPGLPDPLSCRLTSL